MGRGLVLLFVLGFPALASLLYFHSGVRVDLIEAQSPPMQRRADTAPEEDPPPDWREWSYLAANPDVAEAVRVGSYASGYQHYIQAGKSEGRAGAFVADNPKVKNKTRTMIAEKPSPPPPPASPPVPAPAQTVVETPPPAPPPAASSSSPPPAPAPSSPAPPSPTVIAEIAPKAKNDPAPKVKEAPPEPTPVKPAVVERQQPPARPTETSGLTVIAGVRFGKHDGFVRVVIDASAALEHQVAVADGGRSVVVSLPRSIWRGAVTGRSPETRLLSGFEVKNPGGPEPRLILRAVSPVSLRFVGRFLPSGAAGHRLVIDIAS